jgi:hypothetical protein
MLFLFWLSFVIYMLSSSITCNESFSILDLSNRNNLANVITNMLLIFVLTLMANYFDPLVFKHMEIDIFVISLLINLILFYLLGVLLSKRSAASYFRLNKWNLPLLFGSTVVGIICVLT